MSYPSKTVRVIPALLILILYVSDNKFISHIVSVIFNLKSAYIPLCRITINPAKDGLGHNLTSLLSLLNAHGRRSVSGKSVLYYDASFLGHSMYLKESYWSFDHFEI